MFKDYDKYLNASLKVYLFVLVLIFIMKLVGLDYFGFDINNPKILKLDEFCIKFKLYYLYTFIVCYFTSYVIVSLTINENSKKLHRYMIFTFPLTILIKYSGFYLSQPIFMSVQLLYLYILVIIYSKSINKKYFLNYVKYNILLMTIQAMSLFFRNQSFNHLEYNNAIIEMLLNLDYLIILYIYYKLKFAEGGKKKCHYQEEEAGYSSLKKISLKNLPKKLQENLRNFKKQDKVTKLTFIIYFILSFIWNIFTIITVLFAAMLNDTFIECIFILTSFWLSKREFGKAFHLSSMIQCFIVSNLTYYVLNRITTPLGISILIPIMLGVGLSYVTSKLVKETYKPLYKGMPKELFENTILKVVDKDSHKYKICYDFYINGKSDLSISLKYNYSVAGIRKIKNRVNDKIKRL